MRCPVCKGSIVSGQAVQRIPDPQRAQHGIKSGQLGLYQHEDFAPNSEDDVVHYPECCMRYFDPDDNPHVYDQETAEMREQLEAQIREELREELQTKFERVMTLIGEENYNFCVDCWDEVEDEEVVDTCPWCHFRGEVWTKIVAQGDVKFCGSCRRHWKDEDQAA